MEVTRSIYIVEEMFVCVCLGWSACDDSDRSLKQDIGSLEQRKLSAEERFATELFANSRKQCEHAEIKSCH